MRAFLAAAALCFYRVAMHINGRTRVFMILGDPVAQVLAPWLFNQLFAQHGVNAVLVPAQVAARDVLAFARHVLAAGNIDALWVTIPHKTALLPMLDHCDRLASVAQSVNAVRRNADGTLEGALFDGIGFVKSLDHFGVAATGSRALVVGVGGAGVAVAASLAARGAARLALFDVDAARCASVAARLHAAWPGTEVLVADSAAPAGFDLLVNASPLGLRPSEPLPFAVPQIDAGATVIDILMKDEPTPLLRACAARGVQAHPGHEMMLQQAPDYLAFVGLHDVARAVAEDSSALRGLLSGR
jgi:shikimate dehydrogenase